MIKENKNLIQILTYLGSIPFIFGILLKITNIKFLDINPDIFTTFYANFILSFLGGMLFSYSLSQNIGHLKIIMSNVITVILWLSILFIQNFTLIYSIQILFFLTYLYIDYKIFKLDIITKDFLKLRQNVTIIVSLSLLIGLFS